MEEAIYKLASNISTPLALAGITVALFCRIILAVIKGKLLSKAGAEESAAIIKKVVTVFFVLSLVAAVLGFIGWIYSNSVGEQRRTSALESFGHLVTTMRNETERLALDYPKEYKRLTEEGLSPDEVRQRIGATFRQRIDTTVAGDKLGTQMRRGFPEYSWGFFLLREKTTFVSL